ncbi:MAG: hypothetical protein N4J56_004777 [Chroococcidiopsis sp. SAG 2025]|nr:hypothetical protein [Chroococcidiopsis sp. SAG 2025]
MSELILDFGFWIVMLPQLPQVPQLPLLLYSLVPLAPHSSLLSAPCYTRTVSLTCATKLDKICKPDVEDFSG